MSILAIFGAGTLGGSLAHRAASADAFREIRLIDDARDVAAGKALDILQAGPIEGFTTHLVAHRDWSGAVDADVVMLTGPAEAPETEWSAEDGLSLIRQVSAASRRAVIICAGATHRRLVERAIHEVGLARRRVIGSAPEALRGGLRAIVALELACPPSEVALTVLGSPPEHVVVPWSQTTVGGSSLDAQLSAARHARLRERAAKLWPPGPYALAAAAVRVAATVVRGSGVRPACFVVANGALGVRNRAMAAPIELDTLGVARILEPSLSAAERTRLEAARAD